MKSNDEIKVLMRYEYIDLHHIQRMVYIIFRRNGDLYYINDESEKVQKFDINFSDKSKTNYLKYNSHILNISKFKDIIKFLNDRQTKVEDENIKLIERELIIGDILE